MTPERIAELRQQTRDIVWFPREDLRECLDALEAAQAEIADLKRGGVVVPEPEPTMFDINREYFEHFANVYTTPWEKEAHKTGFIAGAAWHRDATSHLHALKPVEMVVSAEEWAEACRELSAWRDATKANERTKALHIGEYHLALTVVDDEGEEAPWNVPVPWTVIKDIMEAIRLDKSRLVALRAQAKGAEG